MVHRSATCLAGTGIINDPSRRVEPGAFGESRGCESSATAGMDATRLAVVGSPEGWSRDWCAGPSSNMLERSHDLPPCRRIRLGIVMPHEEPLRQTLVHEAMATRFSVQVVHSDPHYARQAVAAAFLELDTLEGQLSRFVEGSDVWRINRSRRGETVVVARDTLRCLALALDLQQRTGGTFDVTYRSPPASPPTERLRLTPGRGAVHVLAEGVEVDLGGIGKGYALDRMADLLKEWEVTAVQLAASTSTVLAGDPPPHEPGWTVTFGSDGRLQQQLSHAAFSGSGFGVQGHHITDPNTGQPARRRVRAWARARTAALADALSTAFLVMPARAVARYCHDWSHTGEVRAYLQPESGGVVLALPDWATSKNDERKRFCETT